MGFYVYSVYGDAYFAGCKDTKQVPLKGEMLFIPTYTSGHFVMTVVDLHRKTITVMDSLNGGITSSGKQQLMGQLR
ncbi:hypothetical protein AAVH_16032 [Aphelenchoides avenae]|nr:hypothetical protein AAVH_16032 [Aphelenchus avenae]